jgi:vacuolar-type H+-ATPase subunit I/STV1
MGEFTPDIFTLMEILMLFGVLSGDAGFALAIFIILFSIFISQKPEKPNSGSC